MNVGKAENGLPFFCDSFEQFFGERYAGLEEVAVGPARPMGLVVPAGAMPARERSATTPRESVAWGGTDPARAAAGPSSSAAAGRSCRR